MLVIGQLKPFIHLVIRNLGRNGDDSHNQQMFLKQWETNKFSNCLVTHLIWQQNCDAKLISESKQHPKKSCKMHLSGTQLSSSWIVCAIQRGCTVNNDQSISRLGHHCWCLNKKLCLVIGVVGTSVSNVVEYISSRKSKSFSNCQHAFRPECSLCIDEHAFA